MAPERKEPADEGANEGRLKWFVAGFVLGLLLSGFALVPVCVLKQLRGPEGTAKRSFYLAGFVASLLTIVPGVVLVFFVVLPSPPSRS